MSPEGLAYAIKGYEEALKAQVEIAEAFFFGRLQEGMEGLYALPEDVRLRVDRLIWEVAGGEALDITDKDSGKLISAALMRSLDERMGMY